MLSAARWAARSFLGSREATGLVAARTLRRHIRDLVVGRDTAVCIDGFPRSGNTYLVGAFVTSQPRPVAIAHHVHLPFQLLRAVRASVPCLVPLRDPRDAIASLLVGDMFPGMSAVRAAKDYIALARTVARVRDALVIARFDTFTTDPSSAVQALNDRFATTFAAPPPGVDEAARRWVRAWFASTGSEGPLQLGIPTEQRRSVAGSVRAELDDLARSGPLNEAVERYASLAAAADV